MDKPLITSLFFCVFCVFCLFCSGLILSACATNQHTPDDGSIDADREDTESCQPQTCEELEKQCGSWPDGCGDVTLCGICPDGGECTEDGHCPGSDCRNFPCRGFNYCDKTTGNCMPGCGSANQCGENERCDLDTHQCQACEDNHHVCENVCLSDDSLEHCGDRCEPCPTSPNGEVGCDGTGCTLECEELSEPNMETFECECTDGYHECSEVCVSNESLETCGGRCEPCPDHPYGSATCDGIICGFDCDPGWIFSGGTCEIDCDENEAFLDGACRTFCSTIVDSEGSVGLYSSLTLDSGGVPHISYQESISEDSNLRYATWDGSDWDIRIVDDDGDTGMFTSLAIDSSDFPHIIYYQTTSDGTGFLKYARWTGSEWDIQTVDPEEDAGQFASLALDSHDLPHVSYQNYNLGSRSLKYAHFDGLEWTIETIIPVGNFNQSTSIAVDSSDYPHIVYGSGSDTYDLKYTRKTDGGWEIETVDSAGFVGNYSSISLDSSDYPHISYFDATEETLKYAYWSGIVWEHETVPRGDLEYTEGDGTSIVVDSNDLPQICFRSRSGGNTRYARLLGSGLGWQVVTPSSFIGSHSSMSITVDSSDYPRFTHHTHEEDEDLIYTWLSVDGSCEM